MSEWLQRDYLVFEDTGTSTPAYTCFLAEHTLIGHVRAEDELAAAKVAAGVTGRVRKYAVLEVAIVDLTADTCGRDFSTPSAIRRTAQHERSISTGSQRRWPLPDDRRRPTVAD